MRTLIFVILTLFSYSLFSQGVSNPGTASGSHSSSSDEGSISGTIGQAASGTGESEEGDATQGMEQPTDEETFNVTLEGNSNLNLCYGDLGGRIAWIPPGIFGGVPYNGLSDINDAIANGEIDLDTPYVDPTSTGSYYLGPFIYLDNNNCDGQYDGTETLMEDITALPAGCYVVFVIDAAGNQSDITSITISEPDEILSLIPVITDECDSGSNGAIEIEIDGGTPFTIGEEYIYIWSGPNSFTESTKNISGLISGTYTLLVKDANDCSKTFDFTVASVSCGLSQVIDLIQGWSIISTYIDPYDASLESVFSGVIGNLEIVKDESGNVYWPLFSLNSIGDLTIGEGYQVKMDVFEQITVVGDLIPYDTPITFNQGWNLIGYLHQNPGDTEEMMSSIVDDLDPSLGPLIIVKNGEGDVYWPSFSLNSIGDMIPGQGYQIKMENLTSFSYPPLASRFGYDIKTKPIHFITTTKTDQNMTVGLPMNTWINTPNFGDEIGAFDSDGQLIGSAVYTDNHLAITVWGNDILSPEKNGAKEGEKITFVLWNSLTNTEEKLSFQWRQGSEYYIQNGISITESIINSNPIKSNQLISSSDILGRDIEKNRKNQILFYIYKNGEVEKKYFFK